MGVLGEIFEHRKQDDLERSEDQLQSMELSKDNKSQIHNDILSIDSLGFLKLGLGILDSDIEPFLQLEFTQKLIVGLSCWLVPIIDIFNKCFLYGMMCIL
jgi:hypothetical protein